MLKRPPVISRNGTDTAHVVQLFDSDSSLVDGVSQFVRQGLLRDQQILAVMSGERWNAVAMRLSAVRCPVDDALRCGQLIVRNAEETLSRFMVGDSPDPRLFAATIGTFVAGLSGSRRPLRVYGEMVDVLTARGQYKAALELERLWNGLAMQHQFTLLCGYTAGHFGDPRNASDLRRICAAHTAIAADPQDVLGAYLLGRHAAA